MVDKCKISNSLYSIETHKHLFAAWAASRAASVNGCHFTVEKGRKILEECGFVADFAVPEKLPREGLIDASHRKWRELACELTRKWDFPFTHGVAAKLINCYLKSRFVCGGHHSHPNVAMLHPPIDKLLLDELAKINLGGEARYWRRMSQRGWSNFNSDEYENVILSIRANLGSRPFWMIEEYWRGNQQARARSKKEAVTAHSITG